VEVTEWISRVLDDSILLNEHRDYLMGRGATPELIDRWGIKTFDCPLSRCPDTTLVARYGPHLEAFRERIVYPLRSPRGRLLGLDSRHAEQKDDLRLLLPEGRWNCIWIGAPWGMDSIWEGSDLVVVEGRYDVFAMLQVVVDKVVWGSGSAHLSRGQVEFARRWVRGTVHLVYDRDEAGRRGIEQAFRDLRRCEVRCVAVPYGASGDDPGAIWDRGGREALREAFPSL
jgi:DNA primase